VWARCAAAIERSRLAMEDELSRCISFRRSSTRAKNWRIDVLLSGEIAKRAEQPVAAPALGAAWLGADVLSRRALGGTRKPAVYQHACDVAGVGKALDRGRENLDYNPAAAPDQGGGIVNKGRGDFDSECLHFDGLRHI
jgi:hypothetical protein